MCECMEDFEDPMMQRGRKLEGYEEYPYEAKKIYSIKKDQVYKLELRSITKNLVASKSGHLIVTL